MSKISKQHARLPLCSSHAHVAARPAALEAKIAELERKADKAEAEGKDELCLAYQKQLGPLREEKVLLIKGAPWTHAPPL